MDSRILDLASRQHGVVTRGQLLGIGLATDRVDAWVRTGRLRPVHRGVYLLGALTGRLQPARAREMAAVLACGKGAVVSHESAAFLWEIGDQGERHRDLVHLQQPAVGRAGRPDGPSIPVHVTIPGRDRGRRPGIHPHRVRAFEPEDTTVLDGIPATAPVRTLIDLAARLRPGALERAVAEAERRKLATPADLARALEGRPRAWGSRRLRRLVGAQREPAFTRSEAEERFLALTREGGLPPPETNVRLGGVEVDFLWRRERVVVEVDGFKYHSSRVTFESDRRRDARLSALGIRNLRVTWKQLVDEPYQVLVRLAGTLAVARRDR